MIPPALFFFSVVLALWGLLHFHTNFKTIGSSSIKNAASILIKIASNLQITLGSMIILTILILPIHKHSISFYLFASCSISFIMSYSFPSIGFFYLLRQIYSQVFYYFGFNDKWDIFLNLSFSLLLVYRHATDFCILILYPATLPKQFLGSVFRIFYEYIVLLVFYIV